MLPTLGLFDPTTRKATGSFSETQAEMNLIHGILDIPVLKDQFIQFSLAKYPIVEQHEKSNLICEIMRKLWPDSIGDQQFKLFRKFETFLSAIGKRDHFFHQFLVYLIGMNIISLTLKNFPNESEKENIFGFKKDEDIYKTWLMTSTCHDFGYPYHAATKIANYLSDLYAETNLNYVSSRLHISDNKNDLELEHKLSLIEIDNTDSAEEKNLNVTTFLNKLMEEYLEEETSKIDELQKSFSQEKDHGYISSLLLCKTVVESYIKTAPWPSFKKGNYYKSLKLSMGAIALHNIRDKKLQEKITANRNIYAFLLFIVDNIQDWYRSFTTSPKYPAYKFVGFEKCHDSGKIYIDYLLTSDSWSEEMHNNILNEIALRKTTINNPKNETKLGVTISIRYYLLKKDKPIEIKCSF